MSDNVELSPEEIQGVDAMLESVRHMTRDEMRATLHIYRGEGAERAPKALPPMKRKAKKFVRKPFIAYDLETTNIASGTPAVLYITAFAKPMIDAYKCPNFQFSAPIGRWDQSAGERLAALCNILETYFLIPEHNKHRFIAWNGNKFDVYFIAFALLLSDNWVLHPFLTRSGTIRGLRVVGQKDKDGLQFEFLDGLAMTGLDTVGTKLAKFLGMFAPKEFQKLTDAVDFETESFDANNPEHVRYAERDSEGLFYAMIECNRRFRGLTGNDLQPTLGRAAVYHLISRMPEGAIVFRPPQELFDVLHGVVKRGGYVWINRRFRGKVWKYDLNQAYAGAMRDCDLPSGSAVKTDVFVSDKCAVYRCKISRPHDSPIPFYYKEHDGGAAGFTCGREVDTWITSQEVLHLERDGWRVNISDGWFWTEHFWLKDFVDELERDRFTDVDGPSGPYGTIVKTTGNSSYGKFLELIGGETRVLAKNCPPGYFERPNDEGSGIFFKEEDPHEAIYHQPQLGCFITAHVRLQVRDAALVMPEHFIYADTDCVVFDAPANHLDIDPRRYGAWKCEGAGVNYIFIAKKIYCGEDGTKHAKGMRIKELTPNDFERWYDGIVPTQNQLQRANFLKTMSGADMFGHLERSGTDVKNLKTVRIGGDGLFHPVH